MYEGVEEKALAELMAVHGVDFDGDCPHCVSDEVHETGYGRSRVGIPVSHWECGECGHRFSVYEGARFDGRLVPEEDER